MSFPAYTAYKYSGVDWLGVVPDHWTVTLLKRGYQVVLGKMLQPEARRDDDELLPYLRAANIQLSGVDNVDVKRMWFSAEEKKSLLLRRGDLLVSEGGMLVDPQSGTLTMRSVTFKTQSIESDQLMEIALDSCIFG